MAKKRTVKIIDTTSSATFHTFRIAQRLTLLAAAGLVIWYFATLISVSTSIIITTAQKDFAFNNPELLNLAVASIINKLRGWAVSMSIVGLLITGVLSLFPRARKYEKKLIIDGVLIASFLLAVALTAQAIIRFLLAQL